MASCAQLMEKSELMRSKCRKFPAQLICLVSILTFGLPALACLAVALPQTKLLPTLPGDESRPSTPFIAWHDDLSKLNYVEKEYRVSGEASVYELQAGNALKVVKPDVPYATRILVRRPLEPGAFNGNVYVEILNATAGWDGDPVFQSASRYITRNGGAYVGITNKPVAVNFLRDQWETPPLAQLGNRSRYADLAMPYFGQTWDMIAQIANLLRSDTQANPLADLAVTRLILVGYSQSVDYQITYANHFHQAASFDGYYLAAGSGNVKKLNRLDGEEEYSFGDANNLIRVDAPVVRFQTQTEIEQRRFGALLTRQTEEAYPLVRTYEMAGGAHVDVNTSISGAKALARDLNLPSFGAGCDLPVNPLPIGFVQVAALEILKRWIEGFPPPASRLLSVASDTEFAVNLDENGNAVAGIRLPQLTMPMGQYLGSNTGPGFCFLYGGFIPMSSESFQLRYESERAYIDALTPLIEKSIGEGFLLAEDRPHFIRHVRSTIRSLDAPVR